MMKELFVPKKSANDTSLVVPYSSATEIALVARSPISQFLLAEILKERI